jgi:hypothetical protein
MSSASYVVHGLSAPMLARAGPEHANSAMKMADRNIKEFMVISTAEKTPPWL